jgi:hypothetical protein
VRELRDPIVRALAIGPRRRLPTEAELESAEVVAEIRRLRPQWMRRMPDSARVASLNAFWTRQVWRIALEDSERLHEFEVGARPVHQYLTEHQRDQRRQLIEQ